MKSRLKILLVSEYFPPDVKGGGELSAELLARNLAEAGHEVHVLTSRTDAQSYSPPSGVLMHRTLQTANPATLPGNLRRMLILPRQIRKEVSRLHAQHSFDAIHYLNVVSVLGSLPGTKAQFATINSHQPFCPKANLFYKEREPCTGCAPLKFAGCLACSDYIGKTRVSSILRLNPLFLALLYKNYLQFRAALRNAQPIAVSSYVAERLASIGFPDAPIIPNLPTQISAPKKRRKQRGKLNLLFLGSLEKIKGAGLLLDAYDSLPTGVRSRTRLQIAGSGSLREELERRAPGGIEFLGQISPQKAQQLIADCDIVVLPSLWPEPLSRVLLEAASFGKPIVATDVGGNPDILKEGVGGLLVPSAPDAFAQALGKLIKSPGLRKRLGESGRKHYEKGFSSKRILERLESVYA